MSKREYAQLKLSIWNDRDFTNLTVDAQLVYIMAMSHPTTNLAGVLDYAPQKFARLAGGFTPKRIVAAVDELCRGRFVVTDDDTGEMLVRTAVRASGAWKKPTTAASIANSVTNTFSDKLRSVLAQELRKAVAEDPSAQGKTAAKTLLTCADSISPHSGSYTGPYTEPYIGPSTGPRLVSERDRDRDRDILLIPDGPSVNEPPKKNFPDWWSVWEKKVSKGDAEKAYKAAVPKKISHDDLMAKTTAYWSHVKTSGTDLQYVPYPGKWLRAEQWDDDLGPSQAPRLDPLKDW